MTIEQQLRRLCELEPKKCKQGTTTSFGEKYKSVFYAGMLVLQRDEIRPGFKLAAWSWLEQMQERWHEYREYEAVFHSAEVDACAELMTRKTEDLTPSLILEYYVKWKEASDGFSTVKTVGGVGE